MFRLCQGNAKETKLADKSADLILVLDVYHHLITRSRRLRSSRGVEARRHGSRLWSITRTMSR